VQNYTAGQSLPLTLDGVVMRSLGAISPLRAIFSTKKPPWCGWVFVASHNDLPIYPYREFLMKYLHTSCLCAHGMIAGTLAHDCWIVGPIETHKVIHAIAYGVLGMMQGIALLVAIRRGKCDEAPVE